MISDSFQQNSDLKKIQGKYSPFAILLITILGIAVAEVIAMVVVYFQRHLPYYQQVIIDSAVMTVIIFPILYFLSFKPMLQHIKQRHQVEKVLQARLRIIEHANTHSLDETLQFTLDELEYLTESTAGYFHFIETDEQSINLQTWSTNTIQNVCSVKGVQRHYTVEEAGVWADCIRQRQVVVHNNYASLPNRKGLPSGHAPISREMAIPIQRDGRIVAVLGVGNKPRQYSTEDVEIVSTLADFAWDIVKHKQTLDAQRESEEKFRTLADWTYDWELWLAPDGRIVYSSPSCQRITGFSPEEFMKDPHLLIQCAHEDDRYRYEEHHQIVHDEKAGIENIEYRIQTRDGDQRWVEHVCRPLFSTDHRYLGRRVSNRDITERKNIEAEIEARNRKEKNLTQMLHTMQLDIARDLHDTIGQNIGYLRMKLDHMAEKDLPAKGESLKTEFSHMSQVANESYDLVRGTLAILQLQKPGDLLQLFKRYASQVTERSAFQIEFTEQGKENILSSHQMRQLFYIFREALSNIEKHSDASQVRVDMTWDKTCMTLTMDDNGKGFDPSLSASESGHYGLKFMHERTELMKGTFSLQTGPGTGTRIAIGVPLQENAFER